MIRVRTAAVGAATIAVGGVLAATVIGGEKPSAVPGNPPPAEAKVLQAKRINGPTAGRPPAAKDPKVFYFEIKEPISVPPGSGGEIIEKCPKGSIATNGYWYIDGRYDGFGLSDQGSSPAGFKRWAFYWENENTEAIENVTLGMVCDSDG